MSLGENFKVLRKAIPGDDRVTVRVQRAVCAKCDATHDIADGGTRAPQPFAAMARRFRRAGWEMGQTRRGDLCPAHARLKSRLRDVNIGFAEHDFDQFDRLQGTGEVVTPWPPVDPLADRVFTPPVPYPSLLEIDQTRKQEPTPMTTETETETPAETTRKMVKVSYLQQRKIEAALDAVITRIDAETCSYTDGHSDETVAAGMGFECTKYNVASLRRAVFGRLYIRLPEKPTDPDLAALTARVAALEAVVLELVEKVGDRADQRPGVDIGVSADLRSLTVATRRGL
jgi:hypothetical protein